MKSLLLSLRLNFIFDPAVCFCRQLDVDSELFIVQIRFKHLVIVARSKSGLGSPPLYFFIMSLKILSFGVWYSAHNVIASMKRLRSRVPCEVNLSFRKGEMLDLSSLLL